MKGYCFSNLFKPVPVKKICEVLIRNSMSNILPRLIETQTIIFLRFKCSNAFKQVLHNKPVENFIIICINIFRWLLWRRVLAQSYLCIFIFVQNANDITKVKKSGSIIVKMSITYFTRYLQIKYLQPVCFPFSGFHRSFRVQVDRKAILILSGILSCFKHLSWHQSLSSQLNISSTQF